MHSHNRTTSNGHILPVLLEYVSASARLQKGRFPTLGLLTVSNTQVFKKELVRKRNKFDMRKYTVPQRPPQRAPQAVGMHSGVLPNRAGHHAGMHSGVLPNMVTLRSSHDYTMIYVGMHSGVLPIRAGHHAGMHSGVLPNMVTLSVQSRLHYVGMHSGARAL